MYTGSLYLLIRAISCSVFKKLQSFRKTVNTRENIWNVYCFATNPKRDETANDCHQTAACISHNLIRNHKLAFSSNELACLPRLTFKNQTTEFGIDLEAKFTMVQVFLLSYKKYGSKITHHSQLAWPCTWSTPVSSASDWFFFFLRRAV